jgi:hypothetical protein
MTIAPQTLAAKDVNDQAPTAGAECRHSEKPKRTANRQGRRPRQIPSYLPRWRTAQQVPAEAFSTPLAPQHEPLESADFIDASDDMQSTYDITSSQNDSGRASLPSANNPLLTTKPGMGVHPTIILSSNETRGAPPHQPLKGGGGFAQRSRQSRASLAGSAARGASGRAIRSGASAAGHARRGSAERSADRRDSGGRGR